MVDDPQPVRGLVPRMGHPLQYLQHPAVAPTDVPPLVTGVTALPQW